MSGEESLGIILGSAFAGPGWEGPELTPHDVDTPWGPFRLWRAAEASGGRDGYVSFRHGRPHEWLPHHIPYRAQAWAFRDVGCGALLVTSSVGVLDRSLPLGRPLLLEDLVMLDNRLPDGSACTMFVPPSADAGHLILSEGLFSEELTRQVEALGIEEGATGDPLDRVVFGYAAGPRGKTRAENLAWARLGAQVNSMTLAPEVVLANELEISCAGLVVGHKYSGAEPRPEGDWGSRGRPTHEVVSASLDDTRGVLGTIAAAFLCAGEPVRFANEIYRFGGDV